MSQHLPIQKRPITPQIHRRAVNGTESGSIHPVIQLQRTIGNRATQQLMTSQSPAIQRETPTSTTKPKINYASAKKQNLKYAELPTVSAPNGLGFPGKLVDAGHADWAQLWKDGKYDEFADAVADFQDKIPGWNPDGVLGPDTWSRVAGLGEAMAAISSGVTGDAVHTCTIATEQRIEKAYRKATGEKFELPEDATADLYNVILQSLLSRLDDVDQKYRGTGGAGALVYAGVGTFVDEADIWKGKLKPGAALQVWGDANAYDVMQKGEVEEKGKKRPIQSSDANFYGTSMVFVRYDTEDPERMLVRHFDGTEWVKKSNYAKWVAANVAWTVPVSTPAPAAP